MSTPADRREPVSYGPGLGRIAQHVAFISTRALVEEIARRRTGHEPTALSVFDRQLLALVGTCCIDGGVVEVRGVTLEDAYQYGGETTDAWPVVYGTLDEPALRPDELRLLTPAAQIAVRAMVPVSPR